jgi:hypothetical protein
MWTRPNKPELDATKTPTAIDIAWSAGVYEGEGTARLCGKKKRGLSIAVVQKNPEILYRLRDWFGGNVRFAKSSTVPESQQCHAWEACGDRARIFIAAIYPFLSVRRKTQVDAIGTLEFLCGKSSEELTLDQLKSQLWSYYESLGRFPYESPARLRRKAQNRDDARRRRAAAKSAQVISIA